MPSVAARPVITAIVLERYRVFRERTELAVAPLTVLAGENSAGKSSAMHPLLLMKQTLDAPIDPGPLLLDGDNVRLTSADQMFSAGSRGPMCFGIRTSERHYFEACFGRPKGVLAVERNIWQGAKGVKATIRAGATWRRHRVERVRFLLGGALPRRGELSIEYIPERVAQTARHLIHVSGMRGAMGRVYPSAAIGETYPGTFDRYVARIIESWQQEGSHHLEQLNDDLVAMGLTWKVQAKRVSDVALELRVGRLKKSVQGGAHDLVSLADVGLGVAQALPVLVALRAAEPGQLVYIEQPELHLHPNAQVALATVLAKAVKRLVRVVIETHSSLLLLAIQAAIAERTLAPDDAAMHWFTRDPRGGSHVDTAAVAPDGSFGQWPVDFDDVTLKLQDRFLAAYEKARKRSR